MIRALSALAVMGAASSVGMAPAYASPSLPDFCAPLTDRDGVCTVRLASVTADVSDGTITGAPVAGGPEITLWGQADAYRKSSGFGPTPPEAVQSWDTAIAQTADLDVDYTNPNWYGNAKALVFLPRSLNGFATRFPADSLVVGFTAGEPESEYYRIVSIQPVAT